MNFFLDHKRIISIVAAIMVAVLVVYSYGSFNTYAAAPEISSLPVDIDIDVSYDADTITFIYNSISHTINRNSRYEWLNVGSTSTSIPYTLEKNISGYYIPSSYWYSPSENRLYIFSGTTGLNITSSTNFDDFSYILGYVSSSNNDTNDVVGNFFIHNNKQSHYDHYMYYVDYNNNYTCNSSTLYSDGGRSTDRNLCCWKSNSSYINGDYAYIFLNEKASSHYFPSDLVCIFSNYNISGFYDIDTSTVNTPSYYFNYQYIFYNKDYGYIFVDSADKVKEIGYPSGVNNPRFYFNSICNSYVYTSLDGITWTLKTTLSTLYSDNFELNTSYGLAGDLQLVYTNDSTYGEEPLVTPKWDSFDDNVMKDIIDESSSSYHLDTGMEYGKYSTESIWAPFIHQLSLQLDRSFSQDVIFGNFSSTWKGENTNNTWENYVLLFLMTELSTDYISSGNDGTLTLFGHVKRLNELIENNNIYLSSMLERADSRLKSIYQSISLTNQYLNRIYSRFDDIDIPSSIDYSGKFDKLISLLTSDTDTVIGVYIRRIYSAVSDIRSKLSEDSSVDFEEIITAINDSTTSLSGIVDSGADKLHSDLNYIKALMTIDTVNKLFGDDDNSQNIFNFVTKGIASIVSGSIISDALAFSTNTKDGIIYISSYVNKFYDAVPVYSAVVTVGASFFIIDMVLRRRS